METPDLERFADEARLVMRQAQVEAQGMRHDHVGSEHVVVALAATECRAQKILCGDFNTSAEDLRVRVEAQTSVGGVADAPGPGGLPWSQRVLKICDVARMVAESRGLAEVDSLTLLFAIATEGGLGALILRQLNVSTETLERFMPQTDATEDAFGPEGRPQPGRAQEPRRQGQEKSKTPALDTFGRDLTAAAAKGRLDPVIGRDAELRRLIQILCRRSKNNAVLIGEAGVGKTAVVEGLAQAIAAGEKRPSGSLLYNLYTMGADLPLSDQVFVVQSQVIRDLADKGPCVIVGRCGDYVLRNRADVLRVFLHAPLDFRRRRAQAEGAVPADADERAATALVEKEDRRRAAYYNFYSEFRWGEASHYDLCLNTALGDQVCAEVILRAAKG